MDTVLVKEAGFRTGPPSPKKICDDTYIPPPHREKLLASLNKNELDNHIEFEEGPHKYLVDGDVMSCSVTTLASAHRDTFEPNITVHRMMSSKKESWPRFKYVINPQVLDDHTIKTHTYALFYDTLSCKTISNTTITEESTLEGIHQDLIDAAHKNGHSISDDCIAYAYERGMIKDEIIQSWKDNGSRASAEGTEAHYQMELLLNNEPYRNDPEVNHGIKFLEEVIAPLNAKVYRTEWEIFSRASHIAGSVDAIFKKANGHLIIVDWKRSDKLEEHMTSFSGTKYMKSPLNHLEDCDGAQYALQLSLYKYILQTEYNMLVDELFVCSIHPDKPYHKQMPYLENEVVFLMESRKTWFKMWISASVQAQEHIKCQISGRIPIMPCIYEGRLIDKTVLMEETGCMPIDPILKNEIESKLPKIKYEGFEQRKKLKL